MRWEAPSHGFAYCFEQQLLPGAPQQGVCVQQEFPAKSSHLERGKWAPETPPQIPTGSGQAATGAGFPIGSLEVPACYRLAVHGRSEEQHWATFALQHHFTGNGTYRNGQRRIPVAPQKVSLS